MRWKLGAMAGTLAIAVASVAASGVLAGESDGARGPGQTDAAVGMERLKAEPVAAPRADASGFSRAGVGGRPRKPQVLYFETPPQTLPPGKTGFRVRKCPGHARVVNGYYFIDGQLSGFGLESEGGSPAGARRWAFYLENGDESATAAPIAGVTFGIICVKNIK